MHSSGSADGSSSPDDFKQIDAICDEFEAAWQNGKPPQIEQFIDRLPRKHRRELFQALLSLDLACAAQRSMTLSQTDCVKRFPEFADVIEAEFADPEYLAGGSMIRGYEILETLGEGATANVYRGRDVTLDCQVALKLYKHKRKQRPHDMALAEPRAVAQLEHPNIVRVLKAERLKNGRLMIVSQYINGTTLKEQLDAFRSSPKKATILVSKMASALHAAHQKAIFHRDVSPSNILVNQDGEPFLTDFGLASIAGQNGNNGHIAGTPAYMSPEQARGEVHLVDERSDVFGLCAVFYEMLTGERPFPGDTRAAVMKRIRDEEEAKPPVRHDARIPAGLNTIIVRGLNKSASLRYQNAAELYEALDAWLTDLERPVHVDVSDEHGKVTPRGLDAFDERDAAAFHRLIPGPRARHNLPESVVFWRERIESRGEGEAFTIGVLVGPSGSGKSSFFRAGLKPCLRGVTCCVVNATEDDTETALLESLHARFPGLSGESNLVEILRQIRGGHWLDGHQKLLVVLDQFEQFLRSGPNLKTSKLVQALRHCDGNHTQALLLVRGDYWDHLTECLRELDVKVSPENHRPTDAFTPEHARKVVLEFGEAYGCLTDSEDANAAIAHTVVDEILSEGRLIPVRLALFCRAFNKETWTTENLASKGGVRGVIDSFADNIVRDDTFLSQHKEATVRVMQALLPSPDALGQRNTRTRRTVEETAALAGIDASLCQDLVDVLVGRTPLVSCVQHEGKASQYQLAHDYLVDVIRGWTDRCLGATWTGWAERTLRERMEMWSNRKEARALPTLFEWALIGIFGRKAPWGPTARHMMNSATKRYVSVLAVAGALVAICTGVTWSAIQRSKVANLVEQLQSATTSAAPNIIEEARPLAQRLIPELQKKIVELEDEPASDPVARRRLNFHLALLALDPQQPAAKLAELAGVVPNAAIQFLPHPEVLGAVFDVLQPSSSESLSDWKEIASDREAEYTHRLRAAAAIAHCGAPDSEWPSVEVSSQLVRGLIAVPPDELRAWTDLLQPVGARVLPELERSLSVDEATTEQTRAALFAAFASEDQITSALSYAAASQLPILLAAKDPTTAVEHLAASFNELANPVAPARPVVDVKTASAALSTFDGAVGMGGAIAFSLPVAQLSDVVLALDAAGYQLDALRPYGSHGDMCAATWVPGNQVVECELALPAAEFLEKHAAMVERGLQIRDLASHDSRDGRLFAGVWRRPPPSSAYDPMNRTEVYVDVSAEEHKSRVHEFEGQLLSTLRCCASVNSKGERRYSAIWQRLPIARPDTFEPVVQLGATDHFPGFLLRDCQLSGPVRIDNAAWSFLDNVFGEVNTESRKFFHQLVQPQEFGALYLGRGLLQMGRDNSDIMRMLHEKALDHFATLCWSDMVDRQSAFLYSRDLSEHLAQVRQQLDAGNSPASVSVWTGDTGDFPSPRALTSIWHQALTPEVERNKQALGLANSAIGLHRLGQNGPMYAVLSGDFGRQTASYVVERARLCGVTSDELISITSGDDSDVFTYHLLLALADLEDENTERLSAYLASTTSDSPRVNMAKRYCAEKRGLPRPQLVDSPLYSENSVGAVMIRVAAPESGFMMMGMPAWQEHASLSQMLRRRKLECDFALSSTEITVAQYQKFIASEKVQRFYASANRTLGAQVGESLDTPQVKVTYFDAVLFCQWLSEREGIPESEQCYPGIWTLFESEYRMPEDALRRSGYRLPTEAEWEFSCRAGSNDSRHYGSDSRMLPSYAWVGSNSGGWVRPVASRRPNEFGFFDMLGNASEWCHEPRLRTADTFDGTDHLRLVKGSQRVIRGGHHTSHSSLTSSKRTRWNTESRSSQLGFRIARTIRE